MADNDLALGRIMEYLSHTEWWSEMAVLITEDDSQSGVDHVDSHRTVLMAAGPYVRRHYVSHVNTSFPGLLKTAFWLLHLPPLNLYDSASRVTGRLLYGGPRLRAVQRAPGGPRHLRPRQSAYREGRSARGRPWTIPPRFAGNGATGKSPPDIIEG